MEPSGQPGAKIAVRAPRGGHSTKLDDKSRLKLPTAFHEFFDSFPDRRLFVTSFDGRIAQLYPMSVWEENERLFQNYTDDPEALNHFSFAAQALGTEVEIDGQSRVSFSSILRNQLGLLPGTEVHLIAHKRRVKVLPGPVFQEMLAKSFGRSSSDEENLQKAGME